MCLAPQLKSELVYLIIQRNGIVSLSFKLFDKRSQLLLFVVDVDAVGAKVVMFLLLKHSVKFDV